MSKVHRYKVVKMLSAVGAKIGYEPHGPDVVMAADFDQVAAERETLRQRLTASEDLLEIWRTWLGPDRESCDEGGQQIWDRIDSLKSHEGVGNDA